MLRPRWKAIAAKDITLPDSQKTEKRALMLVVESFV